MTSCMSVVSESLNDACFTARSASSGDQANSVRNPAGLAFSVASVTLDSAIDLLPYFSRMPWSLGRLTPIGVTGPTSPVSITTSIALATMPWTSGLRYFGSNGMRSSNHWAFSPASGYAPSSPG